MKRNFAFLLVFGLGLALGAFAAKKSIDPATYRGKSKKEAAQTLLATARTQAGKGSWERIGVGRVYYLGGMKSEGQAIFDEVTAKNPEPTDWWRIGRVYWEANEWDKARAAFEKSLAKNPKDDKGLAELGAYYHRDVGTLAGVCPFVRDQCEVARLSILEDGHRADDREKAGAQVTPLAENRTAPAVAALAPIRVVVLVASAAVAVTVFAA
jgi:tetratricopeptide (TPR) repeat protein